ncbi:ESX secretion-associated protein EspG [Amycolatopsis acidicola]|uniref:ESX secretion-associated protein EspG n=1 Tax=Amycolatopsis acidicola TaxID=2596893 RepID=A0A5N0V503_9PSEU|nr:ESX secretion-associated protein EspG [Amycolatopsis acidicola]KAA9161075.1 ESX secretion-associated protein EspG [Amycolatopsis acidicola]
MTTKLSTLEFDVLWESAKLPPPHPALRVLSPGRTHTERRELVGKAWKSLGARGLARGDRASGELVDQLNLLANPKVSIDVWVWSDREIKGLAVSTGSQALLGVVDRGEVWLIPARDTSLPQSAVSVAGELAPGVGHSVSLPHGLLRTADSEAKGDPKALVTALEDKGVELWQAQELAGMMVGVLARGQFGVERLGRDGAMHRAGRVIAFHDTDAGRYLVQLGGGGDGQDWLTVAPADNNLLATRVWELLEEV